MVLIWNMCIILVLFFGMYLALREIAALYYVYTHNCASLFRFIEQKLEQKVKTNHMS